MCCLDAISGNTVYIILRIKFQIFFRMSPEMRLDSVDVITVTSVGGGVTAVGGSRPGGNAFNYIPSAPSSVAGLVQFTMEVTDLN